MSDELLTVIGIMAVQEYRMGKKDDGTFLMCKRSHELCKDTQKVLQMGLGFLKQKYMEDENISEDEFGRRLKESANEAWRKQ